MKRIRTAVRLFTTPALEQISASLGSLVFMLISARLLGTAEFGLLALFWNAIQLPIAIFFALILLPISANQGQRRDARFLLEHGLFVYCTLVASTTMLSPALLLAIAGGQIELTPQNCALVSLWLAMQLAYEFFRWSIIRYGSTKVLLIANIIRWMLFLGLLSIAYITQPISSVHILGLNFIALATWFAICGLMYLRKIQMHRLRPCFSLAEFNKGLPLLTTSISNASLNYVLLSALARYFSLEAVGAVQAFRSITNFFGTLSQFIDSHITAHIARSKGSLTLDRRYVAGCTLFFVLALVLAYVLKDTVATNLLGEDYRKFSILFVLLTAGAAVQLLMRPVAAHVRLSKQYTVFLESSALVFFIFIPLTIWTAVTGWFEATVAIASVAPIALAVPVIVSKFRQSNDTLR